MSTQYPRDPYEEFRRLADHLAWMAKNSTEMKDALLSLMPLIRLALIAWIAFPLVLIVLTLIILIRGY